MVFFGSGKEIELAGRKEGVIAAAHQTAKKGGWLTATHADARRPTPREETRNVFSSRRFPGYSRGLYVRNSLFFTSCSEALSMRYAMEHSFFFARTRNHIRECPAGNGGQNTNTSVTTTTATPLFVPIS